MLKIGLDPVEDNIGVTRGHVVSGERLTSQSGREKPKSDKSGILQLPEEWF